MKRTASLLPQLEGHGNDEDSNNNKKVKSSGGGSSSSSNWRDLLYPDVRYVIYSFSDDVTLLALALTSRLTFAETAKERQCRGSPFQPSFGLALLKSGYDALASRILSLASLQAIPPFYLFDLDAGACLARLIEETTEWPFDWKPHAFASYGKIQCLKALHEKGLIKMDKHVTWMAAMYGHLDCLIYAHTHGCPWNSDILYEAARHGHLACLQYAHEQGCPWSHGLAAVAAANGHDACLAYILGQKKRIFL
jgi:hypothetical protein